MYREDAHSTSTLVLTRSVLRTVVSRVRLRLVCVERSVIDLSYETELAARRSTEYVDGLSAYCTVLYLQYELPSGY